MIAELALWLTATAAILCPALALLRQVDRLERESAERQRREAEVFSAPSQGRSENRVPAGMLSPERRRILAGWQELVAERSEALREAA